MKRFKFSEVFQENSDGSLTPRKQIFVNGISFGPGVNFTKGVSFGGVDFHLFKGKDVAVNEVNGSLIIIGFFNE